jgi:hypothetical protein
MITIDRIEAAVVQRLQAAVQGVHIEAYPADLRTFVNSFRHNTGALLVQYVGRKRKVLAPTRGTQEIFVEISAIAKNLRDHKGVYPLLDAAFVAVTGVELTEKVGEQEPERKMGVVLLPDESSEGADEKFEMYLEKNGLWIYAQMYKSQPFPYLLPEESTEILITEIMLEANNKIEITIPEPD